MINEIIKVEAGNLFFKGRTYRCAVGKGGFSAEKKEGDGCTPVGVFALRELWYRADKMEKPKTGLPTKIITEHDGWCDDVGSKYYNRHIKLNLSEEEQMPRHEKLWRDDVYDLIIPLGYNDNPVVSGKGSAIFMHIAKHDYSGTEGCVALAKEDLLEILPFLSDKTYIEINS